MRTPRLYLGTMTFAWSQTSSRVDERVALEMVRLFVAHNNARPGGGEETSKVKHNIDTARIYAGGRTEPVVGYVLRSLGGSVQGSLMVGTKAHPSQPGGLSPEGIRKQLQESIRAMDLTGKVQPIEEYYLHQPDTEHSLLESLQCLHELVLKGVISSIGMSNYHASEMERAFSLCKQHNLTRPTVYQGLYNPLNRMVEEELLPLLRANQCSFIAYNPLAAGMLAGKHSDLEHVQKGRFKDNKNYLPRFYTDTNFKAIKLIRKACDDAGISMVEATYRWLLCHSALTEKDGVLLGASSLEQLKQNLAACETAAETEAPLPENVLQAFEEAWKLTKDGAFPYWRSYSSDMPNRENLDQGAAYDAAKK